MLLLQLHLTRDNDPVVPLFMVLQKAWDFFLTALGSPRSVRVESEGNIYGQSVDRQRIRYV